jgi:hypothetical protein
MSMLQNLAVYLSFQNGDKFPKIWNPSQNSRRQDGGMKQSPYWGHTIKILVVVVTRFPEFVHPCT